MHHTHTQLYTHTNTFYSGPCMTLVLTKGDTGEGIIEGVRQFIGPTDVDQAKQEAPDRWVRLQHNSCTIDYWLILLLIIDNRLQCNICKCY